MSYVNNMNFVNNMSYVCQLYESYEYYSELLKITCFFKKKIFFLLLYKDGKTKLLKRKCSKKILKKYEKKPISKGKEQSFYLLELEKDFIELKDRELKDREV